MSDSQDLKTEITESKLAGVKLIAFRLYLAVSLRTRLVIFVVLFGSAVLTNIFALVYLARSISSSLNSIERIRQRQLTAVQMNAHLRDAEAALYRYQINGEAGFKTQFTEQLANFSSDIDQYNHLASEPIEQQWVLTLHIANQQALLEGLMDRNYKEQ